MHLPYVQFVLWVYDDNHCTGGRGAIVCVLKTFLSLSPLMLMKLQSLHYWNLHKCVVVFVGLNFMAD